MDAETEQEPIGSRFRLRFVLYLIAFLLLVGFIVLWFSRTSIADNFVQAELDKLGVEATYDIADIGFNKQVIRNLVIGDPESPDLTADLVEVGNSLTLAGAGINWVQAANVKLYGRLVDGKISFGELDKFTDPDDDSPLALPDIWVGVKKGQLRIDSEYGAIGASLNGEGNLQNGFAGELAATSRKLRLGDCDVTSPSYFGTIAINSKKPSLKGPLRLPAIKCAEMALLAEDMAARINVELGQKFTSWTGDAGIIGGPLRYAAYSTQEIKTTINFGGDLEQMKGDISLTSSGLQSPYGGANLGRVEGPFALGYGAGPLTARFEGQPSLRSARLTQSALASLSSLSSAAANTPVGPIAEKLAAAARSAGRAFDVDSALSFKQDANGTTLAFDSMEARSRSGATLELSDPLLLAFTGNNIRMLADGNIALRGGGFPETRLSLNDGSLSRGFSGRLQMASYRSGSAQLTLPEFRFSPARNGGTNINGRLLLSGPIPDGQITGLQLPFNGSLGARGGFALFRECVTVQFASLRMASLTAGPTRTQLCPEGGNAIVSSTGQGVNVAARTPALDFNGAVGGTPLSIKTGALSFGLNRGMNARDVKLRMGVGEDMTKFDVALLSAAFGRTITGTISGANGKIASVPLLLDNIEGDWRYAASVLQADATMRVRDEQQVERFRPLITNDAKISFVDGKIIADGNLLEPTTERQVASVNIKHGLSNSTGEAVLTVGNLRFDDKLQPEMLTPLTLGVIANVDGTVTGAGKINWDTSGNGIRSTGKFQTSGLNLAAAFGPVTGLAGEIVFSDLLELVTAPGQRVSMAEVNPGVAAYNGELFYRLLPDYKMEVEGGQWPFAGGMLYLEPTILDLGEEASRRLEFTVVGVDAAQFLTQFDFENMTATGVFDGKLPMVFDQDGGRITGGYLVAREGGGSLSYIGELTYEDMGTFANFAFNALKSLKYQQLTIGMDGSIDGEIITEVKFSGLQQGDTASKNFITKQLAKIPLEFNVRIQAPFMQLMSSAKAFYEPEILVGQNLPALLRAQEARALEAAKQLKDQK